MGKTVITIERDDNGYVKVLFNDGGYIKTQSVEANLLYQIVCSLEMLKKNITGSVIVLCGDNKEGG